jgi:hypothetical protein
MEISSGMMALKITADSIADCRSGAELGASCRSTGRHGSC